MEVTSFLQRRDINITNVMETEVFAKHRKALMLFGMAHLVHAPQLADPKLASFAIPSGAVALYEKKHPGVTFVIGVGPDMACDMSGATNTVAEAYRSWPVPSLIRTKATAEPASALSDGYLYLGPKNLLLAEPSPADVFLDTEFMDELQRRATLTIGPDPNQVRPDNVRQRDQIPFIRCR
jgi:hypothetical protein